MRWAPGPGATLGLAFLLTLPARGHGPAGTQASPTGTAAIRGLAPEPVTAPPLAGPTATAPIDDTGSASIAGFHTRPPSLVFHTPPSGVPT